VAPEDAAPQESGQIGPADSVASAPPKFAWLAAASNLAIVERRALPSQASGVAPALKPPHTIGSAGSLRNYSRRLSDRHLLDSDALENIDRMTNIALGQLSGGISPASLAMAYLDWTVHLAASPGKQFQLGAKAARKAMRLGAYALSSAVTGNAEPCIKPLPGDHRFDHPGWQRFPYNVIYQGFLLNQQWWHNATTGIRGVSKHRRSRRLVHRQADPRHDVPSATCRC
jgi:hypothetical protein